jgi:hypothetical protein
MKKSFLILGILLSGFAITANAHPIKAKAIRQHQMHSAKRLAPVCVVPTRCAPTLGPGQLRQLRHEKKMMRLHRMLHMRPMNRPNR